MSKDRGAIDVALPNMFSNPEFAGNYLFYAHMIGQCSIKIDTSIPAPAGVAFITDHYRLYINPEYFDTFSLVQQLGILKHEMLHILNDHVGRLEDRNPTAFNFATDCAINQLIDRKHLPDGCIYPDNFPVKAPKDKHAEFYYELLKNEQEQEDQDSDGDCTQCDGSGGQEGECNSCGGKGETKDEDGNTQECDNCDGSGKDTHTCDRCGGTGKEKGQGTYKDGPNGPNGTVVDDHGTWDKTTGDKELQKDLTKQMIDRSINETMKAKGNLPHNIEHYVNMFTRKAQVSWKKVLRNIVGNKKVNSRRTIMRSDRRFPKREDLRGKTKDRIFELTVIVDVSGSMSDNEIMVGLNEIHNICTMTNTSMKLIQVDTVVHKVEEFTKDTKIFERSGCGGTIMEPAIDYIRENKIPTDGIILITDGWIEDVSKWQTPPRCRVMFLTTDGDIPGVNSVKRYQQFKLDPKK